MTKLTQKIKLPKIPFALTILPLYILMLTACANTANTTNQQQPHPQPADNDTIRVGLIISPSGPGDRSLNDASFSGVLQAQVEYGIQFTMLQPRTVDDFLPQLNQLASTGNYDLIFMVGGSHYQTKALDEASLQWPNQMFSQIDATLDRPNISGIQTKWQENMFLTGVMAGLGTISGMEYANPNYNKVGILIGEDIPLMDRAMIGFEAGARLVNPSVQVYSGFIGSFGDTDRAKAMSLEWYNKGIDFIQIIGGGAGIGVYMAAREASRYVFAAGANVNFMAPDNIVATATRDVDYIIFSEVSALVNGTLVGGLHISGIREGNIGYDTFQSNVQVPAHISSMVQSIKTSVQNGELVVPYTREDLEQWLLEVDPYRTLVQGQ